MTRRPAGSSCAPPHSRMDCREQGRTEGWRSLRALRLLGLPLPKSPGRDGRTCNRPTLRVSLRATPAGKAAIARSVEHVIRNDGVGLDFTGVIGKFVSPLVRRFSSVVEHLFRKQGVPCSIHGIGTISLTGLERRRPLLRRLIDLWIARRAEPSSAALQAVRHLRPVTVVTGGSRGIGPRARPPLRQGRPRRRAARAPRSARCRRPPRAIERDFARQGARHSPRHHTARRAADASTRALAERRLLHRHPRQLRRHRPCRALRRARRGGRSCISSTSTSRR